MSSAQNVSTTENHSINNYDDKNIDCKTHVKSIDPGGPDPHQFLFPMETWREDRPHKHRGGQQHREDRPTQGGRERHHSTRIALDIDLKFAG